MRRLTGNAALADDLAQDTFIKAYKHQDQIKNETATRSWLFQIAYRAYVDETRKDTRRRDLAAQNTVPADDMLSPQPGVQMDIERAMNALPTDCRAIVILCLAYGFSHLEASKATQMPLGTVKSHVARGKDKLRAFLSDYERAD